MQSTPMSRAVTMPAQTAFWCPALAAAHAPAKRIGAVPFLQQFPCTVAAAIVDIEGKTLRMHEALFFKIDQQVGQGIHGSGQSFLFIIAGYNQCQQRGGAGQCVFLHTERAFSFACVARGRYATQAPHQAVLLPDRRCRPQI